MDEAHQRKQPNSPSGHRLDGRLVTNALDDGIVYADPTTPKLDPPEDEPPSLQKGSMEYIGQDSVPDPDDPSVLLSPPGAETPTGPHGNAFFPAGNRSYGGSPSERPRTYPDSHPQQQQQQWHPQQSSEDEQHSGNLISLGTPEDYSNPGYDPFANQPHMMEHYTQNEFGFQPQNEEEADPSLHYRPRPAVRGLDPLYTDQSPTQDDLGITPYHDEHYQYDYLHSGRAPPRSMDATTEYAGGEEKKVGLDDFRMGQHENRNHHPHQHQHPVLDRQMSEDSPMKSGEEDFIPIKRDGYRLGSGGAGPGTPHSVESENSHQSAAFRGAQEVLRKNRRRRFEEYVWHRACSMHELK